MFLVVELVRALMPREYAVSYLVGMSQPGSGFRLREVDKGDLLPVKQRPQDPLPRLGLFGRDLLGKLADVDDFDDACRLTYSIERGRNYTADTGNLQRSFGGRENLPSGELV